MNELRGRHKPDAGCLTRIEGRSARFCPRCRYVRRRSAEAGRKHVSVCSSNITAWYVNKIYERKFKHRDGATHTDLCRRRVPFRAGTRSESHGPADQCYGLTQPFMGRHVATIAQMAAESDKAFVDTLFAFRRSRMVHSSRSQGSSRLQTGSARPPPWNLRKL